jgi:hypothetical protein
MPKTSIPLSIALAGIGLVWCATASGARGETSAAGSTGNDVSYPQCGKALPSAQAFGIVGVNDGVAHSTNPCLSAEIAWAQTSTGVTSQPKVSLYVNTGNPGNLRVAVWPRSNLDPVTGVPDSDPYGSCTGGDTAACAWQYGWDMADRDAQRRGVSDPAGYAWWLDVETGNSWETNTRNNDADLEGMVEYFHSLGTTVGVYSTAYQWKQIAGSVGSASVLLGLSEWMPGASTLAQAQATCRVPPFTSAAKVTITQWTTNVDNDYACNASTPRLLQRRLPLWAFVGQAPAPS